MNAVLPTHYDLMLPGHNRAAGICKVFSPFNGREIGTVATVDTTGVDTALNTAYRLFRDKNAWLPPARRIEVLERTVQIMTARFEILAQQAAREGGKPLADSRIETTRAIDGIKSCIECLRNNAGREIPMNINAASAQRMAFTHKEPIGVVIAVSAFNHPLNLIVHQIGPAIAAGCPVIVKPAGDTPLSCFALVSILREAGLPDEYCQPLLADNHETTTALVTDPRVGFFSFIGSAKTGWMLRSKLAPGARCALEHGGVAPVIVAADADLDAAVPLLAKGGFYHAGQVCVSVQRIFAHASIAGELAQRLVDAGSKMKTGDPEKDDTEIGPLIRPQEVERIDAWIREAIAEGAQLLSGGEHLPNNCYATTILFNPDPKSKVSTQEIFGPVICVYSYKDIDDAIEQANSLDYAFQAAVFTKDIDTALLASRRLDAASVMINDHTAFRVDWMPFAGLKQSGYRTGGIPYTFEDMQIDKLIVLKSAAL